VSEQQIQDTNRTRVSSRKAGSSIYPASYDISINMIAGFTDHYMYQHEKSG